MTSETGSAPAPTGPATAEAGPAGERPRWYAEPHPVTGADQLAWPARTVQRLRNPMPDDLRIAWLVAVMLAALCFLLRVVHLSRPDGLVFDETYYAKDAYALLHGGYERDWADGADDQIVGGDYSGMKESGSFIVHPQIAKWLIAGGIQLFGFDSFGWRIAACVAGSLLVLVVVLLTRRLARSTLIGAVAGLLLTLDGLHFVMSRIALLDIFQALFTVSAVACLVADRDWFRNRLADHLEARGIPDLDGRFGPLLLWRPWRLAAGLMFGLACGSKWSSVYALAAFSLLSVAWDVGARRLAGASGSAYRSLLIDAPMAFCYQVVVTVLVYVASWWGWLTSSGGYARQWGAEHPQDPLVRLLGAPLASLWHYHVEMYGFHTGEGLKEATHVYSAHPGGWLVIGRPIGIDAVNNIQPGTDGCPGPETCLRVISGIGTPAIWWFGVVALVAALVWWIGARDWRFGVPIVGVASMWLPWFANADRPIFYFYAICIIPFTCIALALCLGKIIGPAAAPRRRRIGAMVAGVYLALVALNFAYLYPILTDELLNYSQWLQRMWLRSWI